MRNADVLLIYRLIHYMFKRKGVLKSSSQRRNNQDSWHTAGFSEGCAAAEMAAVAIVCNLPCLFLLQVCVHFVTDTVFVIN